MKVKTGRYYINDSEAGIFIKEEDIRNFVDMLRMVKSNFDISSQTHQNIAQLHALLCTGDPRSPVMTPFDQTGRLWTENNRIPERSMSVAERIASIEKDMKCLEDMINNKVCEADNIASEKYDEYNKARERADAFEYASRSFVDIEANFDEIKRVLEEEERN